MCQGAKRVSRASKTIKHKTKCQAFRWFLGPQKTRRSEVQEARSKDSRKGLLVGFLEKQFSGDSVGTTPAAHRRKGYRSKTSLGPNNYGPTKELYTPKIVAGLIGRWVAA